MNRICLKRSTNKSASNNQIKSDPKKKKVKIEKILRKTASRKRYKTSNFL